MSARYRRRLPWVIVTVCVVAGSLIAARGWLGPRGPEPSVASRLTYAVEGGQVERGAGETSGLVRNPDPRGARLRFSDGTSVALRRGARARVASVDAAGARLALIDGEIAADVVHRPTSKWQFDAGPFSVFVEGTSFSLDWAPDAQRLRLQMYTGVVTVRGPLGGDAIRVRAGQTLTVRLPEGSIALEPAAAVAANEPGLAPAPQRASERSPLSRPTPQRRASSMDRPTPTWRELVAAGRSLDVVAEAESRGLDATFSRGRREDLSALADAARYSRRNDLARGSLRALRERFSASDSARDAAFFLGLIEETEHPESPRALEWYRRYRAETPTGLYASDALGREMLLLRRLHGAGAARAAAREYLTRFPHGPLAAEAALMATRGATP